MVYKKILITLNIFIISFLAMYANIIINIYGQENGTEFDNSITTTKQNENEFLKADIGDVISSFAASIAAVGLFFNFYQMKKNQANFTQQMNTTQQNFTQQMNTTQQNFTQQMNTTEEHFIEQMRFNRQSFEQSANSKYIEVLRLYKKELDDIQSHIQEANQNKNAKALKDSIIQYLNLLNEIASLVPRYIPEGIAQHLNKHFETASEILSKYKDQNLGEYPSLNTRIKKVKQASINTSQR